MPFSSKITLILSLLLPLALTLNSCEKMLAVNPPATQLSRSNVFETDASANATVLGMYGELSSSGFASGDNSSVTYLAGLSSDDFLNYSTDGNQMEFYNNNLSASNSYILTLWSGPYKFIYYSNSILEGLSNNTTLSPSVKNQIVGEALLMRSFCYFYLVNLFGDVPLILSTDYKYNTVAIRTPTEKIYDQIIADLLKAKDLMATDYSFSSGDRSRPNKYAAEFLLARAYLYTGKYEMAESYATDIISRNDLYKIEDNLSNVFLKNSNESVWQLSPVVNSFTNEASQFILTGLPTGVTLSQTLLNSFESADQRKANWISSYTVGETPYYFAYKYKNSYLTPGPEEYSVIMRLGELLLIRAEARSMQGKIVGTDGALSDINVIRHRAGLLDFSNTSSNEVIKEIQTERQLELFSEWGHRWLDLKRYKSTADQSITLADELLPQHKDIEWKATAKLFPIPQTQLDNDPNMKGQQNPGYN